ncbi:MAG: M36 family metallopeptidase [Chthoniobacteraceae bacterium]
MDTTASPNGWINDGDNETMGNNVDAHLDLDADDQPDLPRPQGSPFRVFYFHLDTTQPPTTPFNRKSAVVQLFYWCNWMHDRLYQLGFDEASGNFQNDNFGRGGVDSDAVQADAQDGSGTDNANFSTPPDGQAGRMQMYLFTAPKPKRDACFDAQVVLHEYTHGLSNRLVGGGVGISQLQTEGMGEGWSDFYALSLLSKKDDNLNGDYPEGAYASYQLLGNDDNYYFGIRRYPYTTNLHRNPLTFKDIDPDQENFHAGIPIGPDGSMGDEVHAQGEVWCVTLWEARANLIRKYGWAMGNQMILQLVTDGMKLSPENPNFLEARDAIIQADLVDNGGANHDELWAAFAKRGLGASASSPDSSTTSGVEEAFDLPDSLSVSPLGQFSTSGQVGGPFPDTQTYTLVNNGSASLNWSVAKSQSWLDLSPNLSSGTLAPGESTTFTASIDSSANSLTTGIYTDSIVVQDTTTGVSWSLPVTLQVGTIDYFTESFDGETPASSIQDLQLYFPAGWLPEFLFGAPETL